MTNWIPNTLTLGNAACGFAGLMLLLQGGPEAFVPAVMLIFVGWLFDMVDGLTARALGVAGPFGAALDSLCDVVTFGILPAVLAALVALNSGLAPWLGWVVGAGYMFAALLRLARFTVKAGDAPASVYRVFEGLSSPAAAMAVGIALLVWPPAAVATAAVVAPLMVSRLPYPDLAQIYLSRRLPAWHLLVPVAFGLQFGPAMAMALVIGLYIVLGPVIGRRLVAGDSA